MAQQLKNLSPVDLTRIQVDAIEELRRRKIVTTSNAPLGDFAEWLFRKAFNWQPAGNSAKDVDAYDVNGIHYQVKARRLHKRNRSRQLGALRRLDNVPFDYLAGVLFHHDFTIYRAAIIPYNNVYKNSKLRKDYNYWIFHLRDNIWNEKDVEDVTKVLIGALKKFT